MARTRNQGSKWISETKRAAIYQMDGMRCAFCNCAVARQINGRNAPTTATLDHVVACESLDRPDNRATNLVTACMSCNSAKSDLSLKAFAAYLNARGVDTKGLTVRIAKLAASHSVLEGRGAVTAYMTTVAA